jgi:class 3 adenylate cyclase/tetratricopeptide (TPR) repeat protein
MTFEEILNQAMALLRRQGRVSYRALKRQFDLDEAYVEDLKLELIEVHQVAVDQDNTMLVWTGGAVAPSPTATEALSLPARVPDAAPLTYTPPHLTDKILATRPALEGERKQVTVLFVDIKDSTELIKDLDPEAAQQLLDPALHHMMDAVHRYEGTVNQVLGDGIMALFGAPIGHEDHAIRACYAALAMQAALRGYTEEVRRAHGCELRIRVGLNAGEVVVRTISNDLHMDYSAVGQTTHLAARMEQMATPGTIRLTAATLRLVDGLVQVNPLGPLPVRGLDEPVEVFELTGVTTFRRRFQATAARGLTQFVGRQMEIDTLRQALARAGAGHGQVVAVVGEAGVGKSRLVYELVHTQDTRGWLVLESASVSYGKATPYFPVLDLLKRYCHVENQDDPRTIRAKVTGQVLTLDTQLQDTVPALLALLDVQPDDSPFRTLEPAQRRRQMLDALTRLLLRESQVQPLLLVFEDLHWIDTETQALLDSLVERLPMAPLVLLVNYRPEYQHGWGRKTYYTQVPLDPLPPASADALVHALLGEDPSVMPLVPLLLARTGGNPFFLEECVRTLVETSALVGEVGAYRLGTTLPAIQVPDTVQAVLAARIDRLAPEDKRLLQTAAVIGTEASLPLLHHIAELPEDVLHRGLAHLQSAEFLYETRLFPDQVYTFKHALTHEVAYSSLLQERRRVLHTRIVEALEVLAGERVTEQVERLAHHALRGELWDKAVTYCWQAGIKMVARSAHREAVASFEQALGALQHCPESRTSHEQAIDLRFDLRNALLPLGEQQRILSHLRDAESLAVDLNDQRRLGRVLSLLTHYFNVTEDLDRALETGQRALAISETLGDCALQVEAHFHLGRLYYVLGDYGRAIAVIRKNVEALQGALQCERFGLPGLASALSCDWLIRSMAELGAFAEGMTYGDEAVRIAEAADHAFTLIAAYHSVSLLCLRKGEIPKALAFLERALALVKSRNVPYLFGMTASCLGSAYALAGQVGLALPLLEQVMQRFASGVNWMWGAELSETYLLAGQRDELLRLVGRALERSPDLKERGHQAWLLRLLGEITARRDPPEVEQAQRYYQQALTLAEVLGMRPLQAHCHLGLGTLYATTGQREQAHAELSAAIALYRAMDMTFWLPQAEAALAQAEGGP